MKPLQGITVIEMARVLACPFAGMILAELGARVIKIEQPGSGDETRSYEPFATATDAQDMDPQNNESSAYYYAFNRSKESISVNLRDPEGQEIVRKLVKGANVVLENFPTGTLARYGLDWESLNRVNPGLVYVSCTGFGQTGPYAMRKGYDTVFQAMSGLMSMTGERDGEPVKPGVPVADMTSGLWIALGVLAMLNGATQRGQGAYLDFSMLDAQIPLLSLAAARFFTLGEVPQRMGTEHPGRVPSASFRCADGGYVHITGADQHWKPLCKLLGLNHLADDERLQDNSGRVVHRAEVMDALAEGCASMTRDQLCAACDAFGVPAGPLKTLDEVISDPHLQARGVFDSFEHPHAGVFPAIRLPYRFTGLDDPVASRPPLLGENNEQILTQLGYTAEQIEGLRARGTL